MGDGEKLKNEDITQGSGRRWLIGLAVMLVLLCNPCSLVLESIAFSQFQNSVVLYIFAKPFFDYPLPPNSYEITHDSGFGGVGTHSCIFRAERLIASPLTKQAMQEYFGNTHLPAPYSYQYVKTFITIKQLDPEKFKFNIDLGIRRKVKSLNGLYLYKASLAHDGEFHQADSGLSPCA